MFLRYVLTTLKTVELVLIPILKASDIPSGIAVHGTDAKAWKLIGRPCFPYRVRQAQCTDQRSEFSTTRTVEDEEEPYSLGPRDRR